jgi:probable phosphoglycerate mutase
MNHLLHYQLLSNCYLAIRHGQSVANLEGKIISQPENGLGGYGLSDAGKSQVSAAVRSDERLNENILIVSSDFKRARESAEIIHSLIDCKFPVEFDQRLRERNFGELELSTDSNYESVWREDHIDADNKLRAVESPNQVMARVTDLVSEYEDKLSGETLLLVSHGDALQILQTAFLKQDASKHRMQEHLNTAEIRELVLSRE